MKNLLSIISIISLLSINYNSVGQNLTANVSSVDITPPLEMKYTLGEEHYNNATILANQYRFNSALGGISVANNMMLESDSSINKTLSQEKTINPVGIISILAIVLTIAFIIWYGFRRRKPLSSQIIL